MRCKKIGKKFVFTRFLAVANMLNSPRAVIPVNIFTLWPWFSNLRVYVGVLLGYL